MGSSTMLMTKKKASDEVIRFEAGFRAARAKVWSVWTEAAQLKKWFYAEEGFRCSNAEVDLSVGGKYLIAMTEIETARHTLVEGAFQQILHRQRLVYTWTGAWARDDHMTLVTVIFSDGPEGGSRLELTQGVFRDARERDAHELGWSGCLSHLAKHLGE
jgi:uncharacterized protein YndB with AHSA1/START domain